LRIKIISYGKIAEELDKKVQFIADEWLPKIVNEFESDTQIPFIADIEIHKANWVKKINEKLTLVYSSGFAYKYDQGLNVLIPTVQLNAAKILTYNYDQLKAIVYHEYLDYLYDCYHGYDTVKPLIWNISKPQAKMYASIFRNLERVFEMALRCFKNEDALINFLECEIDRTLLTLTRKGKPKVVDGFPEVEEEERKPTIEEAPCHVALTIRPLILVTRVFSGKELPNIKELLYKKKLVLEKYLLMNKLFREKAF